MRIEYTAKRNLATGHTVDETYEIVCYAENYEPEFESLRNVNVSLDGSRVEIEGRGIVQTVDVTTDHIAAGSASDIFEEFLQSVMYGEEFVLDLASDSAATAVDPLNVKMMSSVYRRERPIPGYYRYSFTARVV